MAELQQLAQRAAARNQVLSASAGEALADRFVREVIEEMIAEGKARYAIDEE